MNKKRFFWGLVGLLVVIQVFRIDTTLPSSEPNQDFLAMTGSEANMASLVKDACYDCHSHQSEYPWYSQIAPVSWWIQNHIKEGREHVNFSIWGSYNKEDQAEMLKECSDLIKEGEMPMASFTWAHPEARLSHEQKVALAGFFEKMYGESE